MHIKPRKWSLNLRNSIQIGIQSMIFENTKKMVKLDIISGQYSKNESMYYARAKITKIRSNPADMPNKSKFLYIYVKKVSVAYRVRTTIRFSTVFNVISDPVTFHLTLTQIIQL